MQFGKKYIYTSLFFLPSYTYLRFTYFIILILTLFVSINCFNTLYAFNFVIKLAGLVFPLIYLILAIFLYLYDWRRHIKLTISLFSWVVLNLTRQLYKDFESVYIIKGIVMLRTKLIVNLITAPILNLWAILYSLDAKILLIIYLYLIKD